jgi:hypothetical protein
MENQENESVDLSALARAMVQRHAEAAAAQKAVQEKEKDHSAEILKEKYGYTGNARPIAGPLARRKKRKTYVEKSGAKRVWAGNKPKLEHHIVWEQHHGPLEEHEAIRHINGNKGDNRIENLQKVRKPFKTLPAHLRKGPQTAETLWFLSNMPPLFNWPEDPNENENQEWIPEESQVLQWMAERIQEHPIEVANFLFQRVKNHLYEFDHETKKWTGRNHKP